MIDLFANKTISLTLFESLPKEKTALLGVADVSLFKRFLQYFQREDSDDPVPDCPLSFTETLPFVYANPKMLTANQDPPSVSVEISISRPILTPALLASSIFLTLLLEDVKPVPDEWTLKDGNEKDLNSSRAYTC